MPHLTRPASRHIDADRDKSRRCLSEAAEYLAQIGETENPDLAERASAALWDVMLEHLWSAGKLAAR